jgi:hypothetical protein
VSDEKRDPRDDTESYNIGTILVKMRAVSRDEVLRVLREQEKMTEDELIGALLVRRGLISEEQLEVALSAQAGLRSRKPHVRAMAAAALANRASDGVRRLTAAVAEVVGDLQRKRTGSGHPIITREMLDVKKNG